MSGSEPFPLLNTSADQFESPVDNVQPRKTRRSSALGADIRVGDTGAPGLQNSLATLNGDKDDDKKLSKRRKTRSFLRRAKRFAFKHTWTIPLVILIVFLSLYAINPTESNPLHYFIFLAYKIPLEPGADPSTPHQYGKGAWDFAFVAFYTIVLSFTREFIMQELLRPFSRYCGLKTRGKQARFMEQMYTAIYFGFLGPTGLYVMSRTPMWFFETRGMYELYPHKTHEASFKFYYLFQAAYWAQQALVLMLGMEKPRKDFKELVAHHIVSLALIFLSYRFHFTYLGLPVYITHDISDFFLATSKSLNYVDHWLTPPYYFCFMGVWIYLRHYINLRIIWSILTEFRTVGPYELNWGTEQYKCLLSNVITFCLLTALQALNLFWLFFILRIAYRVAFLNIQEDDRSEAEESELEEMEEKKKIAAATANADKATATSNGLHKTTTNGSVKQRTGANVTTRSKKSA